MGDKSDKTRNPAESGGPKGNGGEAEKENKEEMLRTLVGYIADKRSLYALKILRRSPIPLPTFEKFMRARFTRSKTDPSVITEALEKHGFVKIFTVERDSGESHDAESSVNDVKGPIGKKDGAYNTYILLVRDILAIRRPPVEIYDLVGRNILPKDVTVKYQQAVRDFFKKYTVRKDIGDDLEVLSLFRNKTAYSIIRELARTIFPLKNPPKNLTALAGGKKKLDEIIKNLYDKKFVFLGHNPKKPDNPWVILLTDIEVNVLFPEYLINGISEKLRNGMIDKEVAIKALKILKREYFIMEKPKLYRKIMEKIEANLELYNRLMEENNISAAIHTVKNIIDGYDRLGFTDEVDHWRGVLEKLEEGLKKTKAA